jgi:hypothetical protein
MRTIHRKNPAVVAAGRSKAGCVRRSVSVETDGRWVPKKGSSQGNIDMRRITSASLMNVIILVAAVSVARGELPPAETLLADDSAKA